MSERPEGNIVITLDRQGRTVSVREVAHGAAGVVKAMLHLDRADAETIKLREAACTTCEHRGALLNGLVTQCSLCGCALGLKRVLKSEKCPAGKW